MKSDLEVDAVERLTATLRAVPFLAKATMKRELTPVDSRIDFALSIRCKKSEDRWLNRRLVCQSKRVGQPRIAREACLELRDYVRSDERDYPVFIAPYISPDSASICEQYGVGYLDLAGNCRITFDRMFIYKEGSANPAPRKKALRSLYSPKAERVLRVLLNGGPRNWRMQELAGEARVSLGQVANVKRMLLDREWIESQPEGLCLRSLDGAIIPLLTEWAGAYSASRNQESGFYSLKPIPEIEMSLASQPDLALTGLAGAARIAPAVRYQRIIAYAGGNLAAVAGRAGLKPVDSGANVTLLTPYDEGVFHAARNVGGMRVVSPVQLYLDLMQTKGRGEEAAEAILEEVIKPLWR